MTEKIMQERLESIRITAKMKRLLGKIAWLDGYLDHYAFKANATDEPQKNCICNSRIKNLRVWDCETSKTIAYYDGQWNITAYGPKESLAVDTIIGKLQKTPYFGVFHPEILQF